MATAWWLQAQGRLFGPYTSLQLETFQAQGRFAAESLVAASAEGPFRPAGETPELAALFQEAAPSPPPARPLLVLAALRETRPETVQAALDSFGPSVRIKGTLWLIRARLPAAGLRNALSRRLTADEFLLVVEADLPSAAWFNLDGDADRALRKLWAQD